MTEDQDCSADLGAAIADAAARGNPLEILGSASKRFYGRAPTGTPLPVTANRGVVAYEPTELVITARGGTPVSELESLLAGQGQMLPFEPPHFGDGATLAGTVACGLSGPRRPYAGSLRDLVLGTRIVNGKGEILSFGGQVMKNVAGYDVSRLMAGAMGTLGILLEISLKVLPAPSLELTLVLESDGARAIGLMNGWAARPLPLSAACHDGRRLWVRLSGTQSGVRAAYRELGGEDGDPGFWLRLREHHLDFFQDAAPLWRLSVPPATPPLALPGDWILDWGGAQRWLRTEAPMQRVREAAEAAGGHATLFRGGDRSGQVFHPLSPGLDGLHRRLKQAFDPAGILNPGRLYADL